MTVLNLRFQYYMGLSPNPRDKPSSLYCFIVDMTQILPVQSGDIFLVLDSLVTCLILLLNYVISKSIYISLSSYDKSLPIYGLTIV